MIAVTGATGAVGGRVAELLAERGAPLRMVVRDADRAPRIEGAEVAGGASYSDPEAMGRAFEAPTPSFSCPRRRTATAWTCTATR